MAYLLIIGGDRTKYGTFKKGLGSQFSLGNYQYSNTIVVTVYSLMKHKFDMKQYE